MTTLSVVLPLYNAEPLAPKVLAPLKKGLAEGLISEIVVVDDGSTDQGPSLYRDAGCQMLSSGGRLGPGACRNLGVDQAQGDLILFVDSDVVLHDNAVGKVLETFASYSECVALFGSYDDEPESQGLVTQYRNLLHHFTHQQGRGEASTFWAGCGAVRREVFREAGGFDVEKYPYPSIEDIELGYRLLQHGKILLRHEIQCKHLKHWTLGNMLFTDIFRRALPWSRLLQQPGYQVNDLNVSSAEKAKALVAGLFWLSLPAMVVDLRLGWVSLALAGIAFAVNRRFFSLVLRRRGVVHLLAALILHQLYYLYSSTVFVYCALEARVRPAR
jgi:glycosyltransferase involved in cell wall biosynthesis